MIAKKEWFKPRLFGWGLRPVTWEGWVYVAIFVVLFMGTLNLPFDDVGKVIAGGIVMVVFLIDLIIVMFQMYKNLDERERRNQQIIESGASLTAVLAILLALVYKSLSQGIVDYILLGILIAMALAKGVISLYLMKNGK